jgi:hypothetical protein
MSNAACFRIRHPESSIQNPASSIKIPHPTRSAAATWNTRRGMAK